MADRGACLALFDSNVPDFFQAWERPGMEEFLDALPGPYLVLEDGGAVVACGGVADEGNGVASVCWTVVRRDRQGAGLGRRLLEACHAEARRLPGVERVRLETIPEVAPFFARLGYRSVRVEPDGYAPGMDRVRMEMRLAPVNLREKLSRIREYWSPRIVGALNGQHVKLARVRGAFVWHHHAEEDELFLVLKGELEIQLRDGVVTLREGEFYIVPRGVEHRPVAREEVHLLLLEPASTRNTGNVRGEHTVDAPEWI
ncbi:MAG: GNAT family N-acetyltransferase [Longimicrobiales bacterium]|nr:GNAT family N-acetyltransferase [Longimicrobiales bacterium]